MLIIFSSQEGILNKLISPKISTAYHEAGHALAAYRFKCYLGLTSIIKNKDRLGFSLSEAEWADGSTDIEQIIILYAGLAAEQKYDPNTDESGSTDDNEKAASLLEKWPSETESNLRQKAKKLVNENWPIIQVIAAKLLVRKTLESEEIVTIIDAIDCGLNPDVELDEYRRMQALLRGTMHKGGTK
jgi:ATP-dependent Zn protease